MKLDPDATRIACALLAEDARLLADLVARGALPRAGNVGDACRAGFTAQQAWRLSIVKDAVERVCL